MSASKRLWEAEVENVLDRYARADLERAEAFELLKRLGFEPDEADEHLDWVEA